jgi:hypothetical protein
MKKIGAILSYVPVTAYVGYGIISIVFFIWVFWGALA